ncbi:hypothetical protein [Mycobacterium sp. shizuoka-1]|uniref:hypothetical protein n=1 Tax=Mycobacterium sp. shizuoka-1 TaxID=2039281 RepID=UPI000C063890|nr:hypothetical protein [Mycobacterium sp. shizuoka-1]GAY13463.1 hypothetical protein MSZK_01890 [Mycobacterium sp. shizuoka-1]
MKFFKKLSDPATFGGPSNVSVSADDPIWDPIHGISLQDYADLARLAQAHGVTDEAGMIALGQRERGWDRRHEGGARRLGTADGSVDGGRTAVPDVPRLLTARPVGGGA